MIQTPKQNRVKHYGLIFLYLSESNLKLKKMNKQIKLKDLFITAFAAFGLFSIISSFTNVPLESNEAIIPVYEMHKMEDSKIMIFNKQNGEVSYKEVEGNYVIETYDVNLKTPGYLDIKMY